MIAQPAGPGRRGRRPGQAAGRRGSCSPARPGAAAGSPRSGPSRPALARADARGSATEPPTTVSYLLDQGITVKVLSGDAPRTVGRRRAAGRAYRPPVARGRLRLPTAMRRWRRPAARQRIRPGPTAQKLAAVRALQAAGTSWP